MITVQRPMQRSIRDGGRVQATSNMVQVLQSPVVEQALVLRSPVVKQALHQHQQQLLVCMDLAFLLTSK